MSGIVDLLIPHYGERKFLDECLASVEESLDKPSKILIFNNTEERLDFEDPENPLEIYEVECKNVGFTVAINEMILQSHADFCWILNNDAIVDLGTLGFLLKTIQEDRTYGIVSSYIYDTDNSNQICFTGGGEPVPGTHRTDKSKKPRCEKWVTFCSVLIRASMIRDIGLLDSNYFLISSDADYCYTARSRGWKVLSDPNSKVYHHEKHGISRVQKTERDQELKKRMASDQRYFVEKWMGSELFRDLNLEVFPGD